MLYLGITISTELCRYAIIFPIPPKASTFSSPTHIFSFQNRFHFKNFS